MNPRHPPKHFPPYVWFIVGGILFVIFLALIPSGDHHPAPASDLPSPAPPETPAAAHPSPPRFSPARPPAGLHSIPPRPYLAQAPTGIQSPWRETIPTEEGQPTLESHSAKPTCRDRIVTYLGRWTAPDVVVSVLLLIVTALQVLILVRQTDILGLQRKDAIEAGKQTQAIAQANEKAARANERTARAMENTVAQSKAALKATVEQGRQSLRQSRAALEGTLTMSRNDQRAWVGAMRPHGEIVADSPLKVTIILKNLGRTPALNVSYKARLHWQPFSEPFKPHDLSTDSSTARGLLQPTEEVTLPLVEPKPLTKEEVGTIISREFTLYLYGEVSYDDVFAKHHRLKFAYHTTPTLDGWQEVDAYNTAD